MRDPWSHGRLTKILAGATGYWSALPFFFRKEVVFMGEKFAKCPRCGSPLRVRIVTLSQEGPGLDGTGRRGRMGAETRAKEVLDVTTGMMSETVLSSQYCWMDTEAGPKSMVVFPVTFEAASTPHLSASPWLCNEGHPVVVE